MNPPVLDAQLFLSSGCPHCSAILVAMAELVKRGDIGRLDVVNLEVRREAGAVLGVRSVPWLLLGPFTLTGARSAAELENWVRCATAPEGMAWACHELLKTGDLHQVLALVAADTARLAALLPIVANPEASMQVGLGAGVVFEEYAGTPALRMLIPALGALSTQDDARVRADACHYLGLCDDAAAKLWLVPRLDDADAQVREIALEAMQEPATSPAPT